VAKSTNTVWHHATVTRARREQLNGHRSGLLWFTGLSGSGKSTLAHTVEEELHRLGCHTFVFDGDNVRHGLCSDLGFSEKDRSENIRRIAEMGKLYVDAGMIALTAFISPMRSDRAFVRELVGPGDFIEVWCRCPLEVCETRDVKGLYRRARAGEIDNFTGISAPYEEPEHADLVIDTDRESLEDATARVISLLRERGVIPSP
jgi:adenylylsulfate kinase